MVVDKSTSKETQVEHLEAIGQHFIHFSLLLTLRLSRRNKAPGY